VTYTRPWSNAAPSGARAANQADDIMREIRVDVEERLGTLLAGVGTWTNDPIASSTVTRYQYIHWSGFNILTGKSVVMGGNVFTVGVALEYDSTLYNYGIKTVDGSGGPVSLVLARKFLLPVPCTIVDVDLIAGVAQASSSVAAQILLVDTTTTTPTETSLASRTLSNPTTQGAYSVSSGANINQAVSGDDKEYVYAKITLTTDSAVNPSFGFQGIRIRYTHEPFVYV